MPSLFSRSRRSQELEQTLAGLPRVVGTLQDQVARVVDRINATSTAVAALGERVDRLARDIADRDGRGRSVAEGGAEPGAQRDSAQLTAEGLRATMGEQMERLENAVERDAAALRDVGISLLRLDLQLQAQAKEGKTLAEALVHRMAVLSSSRGATDVAGQEPS